MKKSFLALALSATSAMPVVAEQFHFNAATSPDSDTMVIFKHENQNNDVFSNYPFSAQLAEAIEANDFNGKFASKLEVIAPQNSIYKRVIVIGLGEDNTLEKAELTKLGGQLSGMLEKKYIENIAVDAASFSANDVALLAHGINLRAYRFDKYQKEKRNEKTYTFITPQADETKAHYKHLANIEKGVFLARNLTSEVATEMTPVDFANEAKKLKKIGVKVSILTPKEIKKLGMGALEAVGRGSSEGSRLVVAHYKGSDDAPIALVGKGITFDSGGYSIKTGSSIARMKSDMAGAAAALGTVKALALNEAKVNVVAVMGMAANMVSENSVAPGDVVRTAAGHSVEILNTDAEGRLVLSDALWYARTEFEPKVMVDIATLTGSKVRALGNRYAAVFSDDDALVESLTFAGKQVNENLWRLPLGYKDMLKSPIADFANIGSGGPGATTAATFLQQFVGDTKWAHIDIAGNALASSDKNEVPKGGTGYSVRLLTQWIENQSK
ncbi:leucyl aminopeptidase [Pseudoalteromonas sp.]|uniref:leucyl aminopeptidase n=1 Tax=Pseudoalteromonas sp. TaxID=53249 RepID=UPI00356454C2